MPHFKPLDGTASSETLVGSNAPEIITGGLGDDIITGGASPDIFVFDAHRSDAPAGIIDIPRDVSVSQVGETYPANINTMWAQTFTALSSDPGALTLYLLNASPEGENFDFKLQITDPTAPGDSPAGPVLYESSPASLPTNSGFYVPITLDLSGLSLEAGRQYAWIINTVPTHDGIEDQAMSMGHFGYDDGSLFSNLSDTLAGPWFKSGVDLAFTLDFNKPVSDGHDTIKDFSVNRDTIELHYVSPSGVFLHDTSAGTEILTPNTGLITLSGVHVLAPDSEAMASNLHFDWLTFT